MHVILWVSHFLNQSGAYWWVVCCRWGHIDLWVGAGLHVARLGSRKLQWLWRWPLWTMLHCPRTRSKVFCLSACLTATKCHLSSCQTEEESLFNPKIRSELSVRCMLCLAEDVWSMWKKTLIYRSTYTSCLWQPQANLDFTLWAVIVCSM